LMAERMPHWLTHIGHAMVRCLPRNHGYYSVRRRLERFLDDAGAPIEERFLGWISLFNVASLTPLLRRDLAAQMAVEQLHAGFTRWYTEAKGLPLLHRLLNAFFMTYLPDDLHVKMDRMSMAHALETRSPMLDTAVVEFVASLPPEIKIRGTQMKYILKLAFRDLLPSALLNRKKHGFSVPLAHWFRHQLRSYVEETLLSPRARVREYLDQEIIRTLFQEHVDGIRQHRYRLWILLTFETWLRMFEDGALWRPRTPRTDGAIDITDVTRRIYA
jgi:asparagine synthase (glutamine-hydrolysing)